MASRREIGRIMCVMQVLPKPDPPTFDGTEEELAAAIDRYYANNIWFDPTTDVAPTLGRFWAVDFAENARGIYYADDLRGIDRLNLSEDDSNKFDWYYLTLLSQRKTFIPSFKGIDWNSPAEVKRKTRSDTAWQHALSNSTWNKSEFAWDADARCDIFGMIKEDRRLDMDKHEYNAHLAEIDPKTYLLTGQKRLVQRTPDETFGLATMGGIPDHEPGNFRTFLTNKLQRLLLHRKCGLIADPRWGRSDMVFPWAVYEAKGWSGDGKEARRQACAAGQRYLNMLDHLARTPGPPSSSANYQEETSHEFQVFVFTSFGSHWHVLVGIKHQRLEEQHASVPGLSKSVYLFRKIWSGSIESRRSAWELLVLVDRIHEWAVTDFRNFVIRHLTRWHAYCDENFLQDWDTDDENSKKPQSRKRKRTLADEIRLPKWCDWVEEPVRKKARLLAMERLRKELNRETEQQRRRDVVRRVFPPNDRTDFSGMPLTFEYRVKAVKIRKPRHPMGYR